MGGFMSIVLQTPSNGSVTLAEQDTASNVVVTIPAATATMLTTATAGVPIGGPAFSAYANAATSCANGTSTKILFALEEFDTNNNFASSRFTPAVAGYYQINSTVNLVSAASTMLLIIFKNGASYKRGVFANGTSLNNVTVSGLVYCNGSTDYIEIYAFQNQGGAINTGTGLENTWFDGCLVRSAT
jgi:hypothetical protein